MNAGIFLVPAVHEIAISAEFAIAAKASEKPDTHALTNRPALDTGTKSVDASDDFMSRNTRPSDWKEPFHGGRVLMAHPACLDTNSHLIGARIQKPLSYIREFSRSRKLDSLVCCVHNTSI